MTQNNTEGLHSITYLALIILTTVVFFYLRKRHEHNRLNETRLYTSIQHIPTVKTPAGYSPQPFQEPGTGLPTFSAQEVGQRKMPREIDHTNVNRKNLSTISDFANNISNFEPLSRSKDQLNNTTEKMFGDNKRQQLYEPSRLAASPQITSPKGWKPDQTRVESSFRSNLEFPVPSGNDQRGFSHPIVPRREERIPGPGHQDVNKDTEIEYRGFKDGRNFRESPGRFNQLDHSGLSLDSPLRMLGSPIQATDSKKKSSQDEDQDKSNLSILSKIDSFSKPQTTLTQKNKVQERVPHNQRSTQNKLVEKNEKKAKRNQVFIDNESDDEMIVEDVKDIYSENKRPGKDSKGIDLYEKESSKKKYLKTNEEQAKITSDTKNASLDESAERLDNSDTSKLSSKKKSAADLSYISERGINNSMKRYIEKKNMREEASKSNTFIAPNPQPRGMEIEKKNIDPFLLKSQERPQKASLFTAQNPLGGTPTQNKPAGFMFTNQPKSSGIGETLTPQKPPVKETEKILEEEKPAAIEKPGLLLGLKNPVDKKLEEEKEPTKPARSLKLISQPEPEETQTEAKPAGFGSLFSQPNPAETGASGSLFKQPGIFAAKSETPITQQEEQKEEKPKDAPAPSTASTSLFSGAFANKKPDAEVVKDQEPKTESKPLFAKSDAGLFSNLGSGSAFTSGKSELQITKIPSNTENPPSSFLKSDSGTFGKAAVITTTPGLFGSAFSKPKEETGGLVLQKSASQVETNSPPKAEEEGAKGGLFNKMMTQKPDLNSLFGAPKPEEKKEAAPSTSLGLFSTPSTLFKNKSTEEADFKKGDPSGSYSQLEGKPGGLFGQKTEQPLIGFAPTSGSLFSQRDSTKKVDEPKKTEDPLASFAKNPVESPKRGDNPLAGFSQNPAGGLFGMRTDSPKKADKPTVEPVKNPTGNLFGQGAESPKKSEGLFGNLVKPAGGGLFGSGASSAFGSSGSGAAPANGSSGFGSLFKNEAKPAGGLFSNLVNNNEAKK